MVLNKAVRLPVYTDQKLLLKDLAICETENWKNHFHDKVYTGKWNSVALYSPSGNREDIFTESNETFKPTPLLESCSYFREVLDSMLFVKQSVRLLRLGAKAEIKTHRDLRLSYPNGIFRLHIPLSTDDQVDFIIAGDRVVMNPGECWYGDFNQPHSVNNRGEQDRIHLVIDGERNEWTDSLFESAGYDFQADANYHQHDDATKAKVIEELLAMDTPTSRSLAKQLMNEQ
jgi:hypothetical protein